MKERVKWLDVVKTFGIYMVFLAHFGNQCGRIYPFLFTHVLAMFFFVSGCSETMNKEENAIKYIIKKVKTILIPAYFFALLSLMVYVIKNNADWFIIQTTMYTIMYGMVRNYFFAQTLWFLTCLFVMQIMFFFIKKLKKKWLIFAVSFGAYILGAIVFPRYNISFAHLGYNIDEAIDYLLYYAIGYLVFPYIVKLFELDTLKKKIIFAVTGVASLYYVLRFIFGFDLLSYVPWPPFSGAFTPIIATSIIIWAYLVVARVLQDVEGLTKIGKNTLYMCGNEWIVKELMVSVLGIIGFSITLDNPLEAYIYTGILLVVINKCLVPIESYVLKKIMR